MITPADNAAREHVDDERHVQPALPGRDLSEVRYPELVRPIGRELAVDPVQWSGDGHIGDRRANALAAHRPTQALQLHQPANRAARYCNSFSIHLLPDLRHAIDLHIGPPDTFDHRLQ